MITTEKYNPTLEGIELEGFLFTYHGYTLNVVMNNQLPKFDNYIKQMEILVKEAVKSGLKTQDEIYKYTMDNLKL